jgi:hypothetical protein
MDEYFEARGRVSTRGFTFALVSLEGDSCFASCCSEETDVATFDFTRVSMPALLFIPVFMRLVSVFMRLVSEST